MEFSGDAQALKSIRRKLSQSPPAQAQPSINKVHKPLRNIKPKAYEPEIIAIGPYHHGKCYLKKMEEHKVRYLESFLQRNNEIDVEGCISAVAEMEQEARNCYAEPISFNKAKLIEILVLDGCFIIELMLKFASEDASDRDNDPVFKTKCIMTSVKRDLILLENQIPFLVLCKLFDLIVAPKTHDFFMNVLLVFFRDVFPVPVKGKRTIWRSQEVKHLLDLVHGHMCPSHDAYINVNISPQESEYEWIHNATELTGANVKFRKWESYSPFEIKFENGIMQMPRLTIRDRTECVFRNIIAYELYFPSDKTMFITDYVRLMECIINSSRDVEILSQHGIIDNWLGDNEVVANMFNRLTQSVTGAQHFIYAETCCQINDHCKKRWNRAWAVLNRDYFNSPWAYISFFAALVLLLLTVAQTVFSVLQVV